MPCLAGPPRLLLVTCSKEYSNHQTPIDIAGQRYTNPGDSVFHRVSPSSHPAQESTWKPLGLIVSIGLLTHSDVLCVQSSTVQ